MEVFDAMLGDRPNQIDRQRDDVHVTAAQLLDCQGDTRRDHGGRRSRHNISVGIQYLESWLRGNGAVADLQPDGGRRDRGDQPRADLAVDSQRRLDRGRHADHRRLVRRIADEELEKVKDTVGDDRYAAGRYNEARELFEQVALADEFVEFLTLPAYVAAGLTSPCRRWRTRRRRGRESSPTRCGPPSGPSGC